MTGCYSDGTSRYARLRAMVPATLGEVHIVMVDRSQEYGLGLEVAVEQMLQRLGLSFKREPGRLADSRLDFWVSWTNGRVWIEAKHRYDRKADNLSEGETYIRSGYPRENSNGGRNEMPNILTGVQRKVRDAYRQYERQDYDPNTKLIIALSYTKAFPELVEDAVLGRSHDVMVINYETRETVANEWEREPSKVFVDEYPNLVGVLHHYDGSGANALFRYYPNIGVDWESHTPPAFRENLVDVDIQSLGPVSVSGKWDQSKFFFLPINNAVEFTVALPPDSL